MCFLFTLHRLEQLANKSVLQGNETLKTKIAKHAGNGKGGREVCKYLKHQRMKIQYMGTLIKTNK